jgi:hypothetical protein
LAINLANWNARRRGHAPRELIEHDSAPWNPLGDAMQLGDDGEWRLREKRSRLPLTYTLQARKL